jgi:hypothetical protein
MRSKRDPEVRVKLLVICDFFFGVSRKERKKGKVGRSILGSKEKEVFV